jgi:hypothetical protein
MLPYFIRDFLMLQKINMYKVHVLADGYSRLGDNGFMLANGSSTLVIGPEIKVRLQQKMFFSQEFCSAADMGCLSWIPDPYFFILQIPDPEPKRLRILDPDLHQRI